jgi:hypothetical protein
MPKYVMKNGLKKQPFDGFRDKVLDNGIKVREYVSFVFEPNKVIETGDFDLSNWVKAKYLVEIKDESDNKKSIIEEYGEKTEDFDSEKLDDEKLGELNKEVVIDNKENNIDGEDEEKDDEEDEDGKDEEEDEDEEESDIKKNDIKYETMGDGFFRCIICGKILKSEKRMSTHIRKKHSRLESK